MQRQAGCAVAEVRPSLNAFSWGGLAPRRGSPRKRCFLGKRFPFVFAASACHYSQQPCFCHGKASPHDEGCCVWTSAPSLCIQAMLLLHGSAAPEPQHAAPGPNPGALGSHAAATARHQAGTAPEKLDSWILLSVFPVTSCGWIVLTVACCHISAIVPFASCLYIVQ